MGEFDETEARILKPYFTNLDRDVFALRNLPEVVKGALFSRYSRSTKSLRRLLLDEFIQSKDFSFDQIVSTPKQDETVAIRKAEEFYDRVLVGFGDDSVAELGGAHIACENISNIATKTIQDARLGISPLEKSTRYVPFHEKKNGKYAYYREQVLMAQDASAYEKACDALFDTYASLQEPLNKYVQDRFPKGDASDRAYASAVKAKVFDLLRGLLPASTLTNTGLYGNGRSFEYLLTRMYASPLQESSCLASQMQEELSKVIPSFVKRSDDKYGKATQDFLRKTTENISSLQVCPSTQTEEVVLVEYDENAEDKIVAAILYEASNADLASIKKHVSTLSQEQKQQILDAYCGHRQNRRHKPGRAFENAQYTFSIQANYGAFRDLHRHRILTQVRQPLGTAHGFDLPTEIIDAGAEDKFVGAINQAKEAYDVFKENPLQAQYVVPMAFKMQWYFTLNLREAFHLIELRAGVQGHADYRRVAQKMFHEIQRVHPSLAKYMRFVDLKSHGLERMESEKRIDERMKEVKEKYG
ncbi:FAD-dependent thymidylate synthase [Candidatus Micrarchaeota archaeon]|nr:FAD-dependent thymidylate synthase [Candidatus Micrarchaeota archaeon]